MMNRRALLSAILGAAPAAAAAVTSPAPDLTRWKLEPYTFSIECDCETPFCPTNFDARWIVTDRSTLCSRFFCDRCADEFRRSPVPLLGRRLAW